MDAMTPEPMSPANDAEALLLEKAREGERADVLHLDDKNVRATFLRDLCVRPNVYGIHAKGARLKGATISGQLDFQGAILPLRLGLFSCALEAELLLRDAEIRSFYFNDSSAPGLRADRLRVIGSLFLRRSTINGETRLMGAEITGDLSCSGANFDNPKGKSFNAQRMTVGRRLFLRNMNDINGRFDLNHAHVGDFIDDGTGWPPEGKLHINGFVYDNLGYNKGSAADRIRWLGRMKKTWNDAPTFYPQPYEQLIKVYRQSGHEREARLMAIAKQEAYCDYLQRWAEANPKDKRYWSRTWLWIFGRLIGFGYEPWRILIPILAVLFFSLWVFSHAYHNGAMRPSKERIYTQQTYQMPQETCGKEDGWSYISPDLFKGNGFCMPDDYPEFNQLTYAIDTFFPIVDLHQETYWLPKAKTFWHGFYRFYLWLHIAMGWFLTTIAVVGFTGIIKKD